MFPLECPFVRPSARHRLARIVFDEFHSNFAFTCTSGVSGFGLLIGKFRQFLTELSARHTPVFSFPDDNLRKCKSTFTKLGMFIDIMEIWFGI